MKSAHPSYGGDELRVARAYGRKMYERAVVAEADRAVLEDRLHEALRSNDELRAQLGRQPAGRCPVCLGLTESGEVCQPCRVHLEPTLRVVAEGITSSGKA